MAIRAFCLCLLLLFSAVSARAQSPTASDDAAIRALVARWYEELLKKDEGRVWNLTAPGFIEASPHYHYANNGSAALGRPIYDSLAVRALKFSYEIEAIRADASFAKVRIWERGYFYAAAAQTTYENAAATMFILERQEKDGRWLILAHESSSRGIPPDKVTNPLPDLRALYYATQGKHRDPIKDAEAAKNF